MPGSSKLDIHEIRTKNDGIALVYTQTAETAAPQVSGASNKLETLDGQELIPHESSSARRQSNGGTGEQEEIQQQTTLIGAAGEDQTSSTGRLGLPYDTKYATGSKKLVWEDHRANVVAIRTLESLGSSNLQPTRSSLVRACCYPYSKALNKESCSLLGTTSERFF